MLHQLWSLYLISGYEHSSSLSSTWPSVDIQNLPDLETNVELYFLKKLEYVFRLSVIFLYFGYNIL